MKKKAKHSQHTFEYRENDTIDYAARAKYAAMSMEELEQALRDRLAYCAVKSGYASAEECAVMSVEELEALFIAHNRYHILPRDPKIHPD